MKNQFGYKLIKVKGILCSAAFFLGMMVASPAALAYVDDDGTTAINSVATATDVQAASTAQATVDTNQNTSIATNSTSISNTNTSVATNSTGVANNSTSIATNSTNINTIVNDPTTGQVQVNTATIGLGGLTVQGATQLDGALNVDGATTTNGITNTGDIATGTLQTTGLATLNSAQVDTTLNVDGATTLNSSLTQTGGDASFTSADGLSNLTVENGEISAGTTDSELSLSDAEVSLTLNNGVSDHGLVVTTTSTTLSGGATSSQMVLDDNGATFSEVGSGDPIIVTGVADGVSTYDAVNKGQLDALEGKLQNQIDDNTSGIAAVAAMANIPAPLPGHKYSMGVGYGNFQGEQAIAFGGTAMVNDSVNLKLSAGVSGSDVTLGAGAGISW